MNVALDVMHVPMLATVVNKQMVSVVTGQFQLTLQKQYSKFGQVEAVAQAVSEETEFLPPAQPVTVGQVFNHPSMEPQHIALAAVGVVYSSAGHTAPAETEAAAEAAVPQQLFMESVEPLTQEAEAVAVDMISQQLEMAEAAAQAL